MSKETSFLYNMSTLYLYDSWTTLCQIPARVIRKTQRPKQEKNGLCFLSVLMPAGGELLPGDESDRRPAAHVHERRGRLLGPVTAPDQPETRHAR